MSDNTMQPLIRVRGLKKSFGDLDVLKGIDVDINKGDVVFVVGPSGQYPTGQTGEDVDDPHPGIYLSFRKTEAEKGKGQGCQKHGRDQVGEKKCAYNTPYILRKHKTGLLSVKLGI